MVEQNVYIIHLHVCIIYIIMYHHQSATIHCWKYAPLIARYLAGFSATLSICYQLPCEDRRSTEPEDIPPYAGQFVVSTQVHVYPNCHRFYGSYGRPIANGTISKNSSMGSMIAKDSFRASILRLSLKPTVTKLYLYLIKKSCKIF